MALKVWNGSSDGYWDTAANWTPSGVPAADDDVVITGSVSLIGKASGSEDTAIANQCGNLSVINYTGQIGNYGTPLTFDDTDGFTDDIDILFAGTGRVYINLGEGATTGVGTAPTVTVVRTAAALDGEDYGMYLDAKSLKKLVITGGSVAVGSLIGNALAVTDMEIREGTDTPRVLLGVGTTATNIEAWGGDITKDSTTTVTSVVLRGNADYTHQAGTITDFDLYENAVLDTTQSDTAVTITNGTIYGGTYKRHPNRITHTNEIVIAAGTTVTAR